MASISTAVDLGRVSAIAGYEIAASLEGIGAGFLPQRIAILGQKATANEAEATTQLSATSASEVGKLWGFNSQLYALARMLRPLGGDVLGGIPTVFYPVAEPGGATATTLTITPTGTVSKTVTHYVKLNGRTSLDGSSYGFVVEVGDTPAQISQKIIDALNNALGCPVIGTLSTDDAVLTSGWKGASSAEMSVEIDVKGDSGGISYNVVKVAGAGDVSITDALDEFGNEWNTVVINPFGSSSSILGALELFNGNPNDKSGRFLPTEFKPFVSYFGDNTADTLTEVTAIADARLDEVTNAFCPAPNSAAMSGEVACAYALKTVPIAQNIPHKSYIGLTLSDIPVGDSLGDFADPSKRDQIVKVGGSTVKQNGNKYEIVDFVTTYHPVDEPQTAALFRWVRDLMCDFNMRYKYLILENIYLAGKTIIGDDSIVGTQNTISPKRWKSILLNEYAPDLVDNALMADFDYFKESLQVQPGESNPNRFETTFKAQRTGVARVLSTTNQTQFKFNF